MFWFVNRFPFSDVERLSHWIKFCQRDRWSLHSRSAICSRHFTKDCFDRSREVVYLKPDAVPTIEIFVTPQKVNDTFGQFTAFGRPRYPERFTKVTKVSILNH